MLKVNYAQWTLNTTQQCFVAVQSVVIWDVNSLYQSAVMADVVTVKTTKIDALLTKMWSFQGCLASYFRIIKVLIIYRRNEISSPISFNLEFGQLFAKKVGPLELPAMAPDHCELHLSLEVHKSKISK